eukprot:TRINITY_DN3656_c1_g1_i8.p1 TRINITY_DN3656_c1_g1~~TRINITY_DN3656_c1_g1_i8.p1  ORF type:complete len:229 (+),score=-18.62 TRINITY_DN3656_c1_g1_i8:252-938(+)
MTTFGCQKKTTKSFTFFNCFLLKVFKSRIAFFQQIIHSLKKSQRHKCNTKTLNQIKYDNLCHPKENYGKFNHFFQLFLVESFQIQDSVFSTKCNTKTLNQIKYDNLCHPKENYGKFNFFNCFLLRKFSNPGQRFFNESYTLQKKPKTQMQHQKYQAKSNMTTFGTQKKTTKNFIFFNCFLFQIKDSVFSSNSIIDISSYFYSFFIFYLLRQSKLLIKLKILQLLKLQT